MTARHVGRPCIETGTLALVGRRRLAILIGRARGIADRRGIDGRGGGSRAFGARLSSVVKAAFRRGLHVYLWRWTSNETNRFSEM